MSPPGIAPSWALAGLALLFGLPLALHACPQSCSCPSPNEVHCTFRHLTSVPASLPHDAQRINLGYNNIQAVGGSAFSGLSRLEMLMLHGNSIGPVSKGAFQHLQSLQILKLSYNKLKVVSPQTFKGLARLVRLHLDHNVIEFIEPFSFTGLTALRLLQLEGNRLRDLHPHTFVTLSFLGHFWSSSLRHLYLSDNRLQFLLPGALQPLGDLEVLHLHGNPWTCDCQLQWLVEWNKKAEGVIKCKKERESESCALCFSPQSLNGSQVFHHSPEEFSCDKPEIQSPLKQSENAREDSEPEPLSAQDFKPPLGKLTFVLSDNQENMAHVGCKVTLPREGAPVVWEHLGKQGELAVNVSLQAFLECEIEKDELQRLWRLIAYYYESPAILQRGQMLQNASQTTFQYRQVPSEDTPYFTELKGHLLAEPAWLLQPNVSIQLNRRKTTTSKLVLNYTTHISHSFSSWEEHNSVPTAWVMIRRGPEGRVKAVLDGTMVTLGCEVVSSEKITFEWILPDLSRANASHDRLVVSKNGNLVIEPVDVSDSGVYYCLAQSEDEIDLVPFRLTVRELLLSPETLNGKEMSLHSGDSLTLPCSVSLAPPNNISWFLPQNIILLPLTRSSRRYVSQNGTLIITKASQEDAGEYSCLANNLYGVDMLSHLVVIKEKVNLDPSQPGGHGKESTARMSYQRYQSTEEEELGSGGEEPQSGRVEHHGVSDKTTRRPPGTVRKGSTSQDQQGRKSWEGKRRTNLSVKDIDPKRWAQLLTKAHAKPPAETTSAIPEIYENTITQEVPMPPGYTEKESESTEDEFEPLQPTPTLLPKQIPETSTSPHYIEPVLPKMMSVTPSQNVFPSTHSNSPGPTPGAQWKAQAPKPDNKMQEGQKTRVTAEGRPIGRTPLQRRRRPFQSRYRPIASSQKPLPRSPLPTQSSFTPMVGIRPVLINRKQTGEITDLKINSSSRVGRIQTNSGPIVSSGLRPISIPRRNATIVQTDHLPTETKEANATSSSTFKNEKNKNSDPHDAFSGARHGLQLAATKIPKAIESTGKASNFAASSNYRFQTTQAPMWEHHKPVNNILHGKNDNNILPSANNVGKIVWFPKETKLKIFPSETSSTRIIFHQSTRSDKRGTTPQTPTGKQWRATEQPRFEITKALPPVMMQPPAQKTNIKLPLPYIPVSFPSQSTLSPPLAKPQPTTLPPKHNTAFPAGNSQKPNYKSLTASSSRKSTWAPEKVVNGGQAFQESSSLQRETQSKIIKGHEGSLRSKSESPLNRVVQGNSPQSSRKYPKAGFQVPPTYHPSITTFPWATNSRAPAWPSNHGSQRYPSHPIRAWSFHRIDTRDSVVTNRPEITALTAKPTAFVPVTASLTEKQTLYPTFHPPKSSTESRAGESTLVSRLWNRYRHPSVDPYHPVQVGRSIAHQPKINQPSLHPRPSPASPKHYRPVTPVYPSLPFTTSQPSSTPSVLFGGHWHYNHWLPRKSSTALPLPNLMGKGIKPRIFSVISVSVPALAETNVFLPCKASGDPPPSLSWTKVSTGATMQANTSHGQRFEVLHNGTFVIQNVQLQDRGQYLCTAQNKFGSDRMVITLTVLTQPPKIKNPTSKDISVYIGRSVDLECIAEGKPQAQISWILSDRTFVRSSGPVDTRGALLPNGTLRLQAANFSSKGDYKCIASNAAGADTVTYHLHVAALPPSINEEASEKVALTVGRSVYIHCTARGEPEPLQKWTLPGGMQIKPSQFLGRRLFVFPNGTLFVMNVSPSDSGVYECSATNTVGTSKRLVHLHVKHETSVLKYTPSQQHRVAAMYGTTVYLHCPVSEDTQHGALWRLPSKKLVDYRYSPERQTTAFPNGTLRIQSLTERDSGDYICMSRSLNDEEMALFQLEVLMKPPKIEHTGGAQKSVSYGGNFQVDCVASGLPNPEVTWSLPDGTMISNTLQSDDSGARSRRYVIGNGTLFLKQVGMRDEGDYTCYAENKLGKDEMRFSVRVVPDSPSILFKEQTALWGRIGEPAYMKCEAIGEPAPTIIWLSPRNDIITVSNTRYQVLGDGTLVIRKVGVADRGTYACVARNTEGDDIKNVKLEVEGKEPQINRQVGNSTMKATAVSYQTKMLACNVEGLPEPHVSWTTSYGITLPTPYLGGRFQVHRNGSLELRGLRRSDAGQFLCMARNEMGEARLEVELEVIATAERPSFKLPQNEAVILKPGGKAINLDCITHGKPAPQITWVLPNGTMLAPGTRLLRFLHVKSNGTLQILSSVSTDAGAYRCMARNTAGQAEKRYILEPGRKPKLLGPPGQVRVSYGESLNLHCSVEGWPQPTIYWTLANGLVMDKPQVIGRASYLINGTLQLRETLASDRGTYSCKATNEFGTSSVSIPVIVTVYPPRITNAPPSITRVNRGSPVQLTCVAFGIPKPDISWTLPGRTTLVPSNRFATQGGIHMTPEGTLVIQNPVLLNSGIYKCNVKNALGMDFKATYLQVL
ncbi:matrix-remodeling-associated protein 5-like [Acipenser oxyrinchus oxyrinchus]|uniref:Matrix-remodeling-associated protein 5-like n=1 Tax=Acipenser oxyrinchus oxyrinchus TaxID=40147 RepID=A0AAD8DEH5_ACIOX|nr:matrix-remodeling-associated protein 5-like [Acipenser oxyrinchus oxyrinchus]